MKKIFLITLYNIILNIIPHPDPYTHKYTHSTLDHGRRSLGEKMKLPHCRILNRTFHAIPNITSLRNDATEIQKINKKSKHKW